MGCIKINGVVYSSNEAIDIIYKNSNIESTLTEVNNVLTEKKKNAVKLVAENNYQDKNDNTIYFIDNNINNNISANNIMYDYTKKTTQSVNVQDALDECYCEAQHGKQLICDGIQSIQGNANITDTFNTLNNKINNNINIIYNNKYNDSFSKTVLENQLGNAIASDVLVNKTFTNNSAINIQGAMIKNDTINQNFNPSTVEQVYMIPEGYHDGTGKVTLNASELTAKSTLSLYLSHRHYTSTTVTTDFNVQGYNKLSKTMSDTANTKSAKIIGYKSDGSDGVTINSTIGSVSNLDIAPYYKIRIQSTASSVDDADHHIKYIGTFKFEV